jgi:hypothetical protein
MTDFMTTLFGPLNKEWCNYFLFLSMFMYVLFVIAVLTEIFFLFNHYKTLDLKMVVNGVLLLLNAFLAYIVNRLLYTMCVKSL